LDNQSEIHPTYDMTKTWKDGVYTYLARCDKCDNHPAISLYLLGRYPSTLCSKCRTKIEVLLRDTVDYKVWVGANEQIMINLQKGEDTQELRGLVHDVSTTLFNEVLKEWLEKY